MNDSTSTTLTASSTERWITPNGDIRDLDLNQPASALDVLREHFTAAGWVREEPEEPETTRMSASVVSEAANAWLDLHPAVRDLIPSWAEVTETEFEDDMLYLSPRIIRGEVEVEAGIIAYPDGTVKADRPVVFMPGDTAGWHSLTPSELVQRIRDLGASLTEIADLMDKGIPSGAAADEEVHA
ncbi:hypothetical protein [Microbacterium sp. ZW T5_56]|uniref:hypothetical protein n=1 Tax=Microbacterium sp. ZW T5_56 TaxID=3378081 RepID=UPI003851F5F2